MSTYLGKYFGGKASGAAAAMPEYDFGQVPAAAAPPGIDVSKAKNILQLVRPSARDRWMTTVLGYYTPRNVENIIRSAMSGYLPAVWMMFDLMERTWPRLSKNMNELKLAACNLNRIVQPFSEKDEKPTAEAIRQAKQLDRALMSMRSNKKKRERDLSETLYDILDSLGKGIELSQILWEQRPVKSGDGESLLWMPKSTQWVHPRFYGYPPAGDELMLNAREVSISNPDFNGNTDLWVPIPDDEFIVSIIQQKTGHPVNGAMLMTLGFFWAASNFTWEWFLNFAQIFGMPIRWATYDPATSTQETIDLIERLLAMMGSSGYAAFPAGTNLELKEAAKNAQDNPQKLLIDAADEICDLVVFWESSTSQHGGAGARAGGSEATARVGQDKRGERIQAAGNSGASIINESLIPAFCRLNYGDDSQCPQLLIVTKANKDLVKQAQRYQIILQTPGVTVSRQQYYEDNELVMPEETDDVLEAQAPGGQQQQNVSDGGDGGDGGEADAGPGTAVGRFAPRHSCGCGAVARARSGGNDALVSNVLRDLAPVQEQWLGGVRPFFEDLIAKAKDGSVSDEDFVATLERASREIPELFSRLKPEHLAEALENAMGSSFVNGYAANLVKRRRSQSGVAAPPAVTSAATEKEGT